MVTGDYGLIQFTQTTLPLDLSSSDNDGTGAKHRVAIQSAVTVIE